MTSPLSAQCTAKAKSTQVQCRHRVRGGGVCPEHGGNAPQVKAKRLERVALAEAAVRVGRLPQAAAVTPGEALLEEVDRTAAIVRAVQEQLEEQRAVDGPADAALVAGFRSERAHLVKVAEAAERTKVFERQVAKADRERMLDAAALTAWTTSLLAAFGHDVADQAVRATVQRALRDFEASRQSGLVVQ